MKITGKMISKRAAGRSQTIPKIKSGERNLAVHGFSCVCECCGKGYNSKQLKSRFCSDECDINFILNYENQTQG